MPVYFLSTRTLELTPGSRAIAEIDELFEKRVPAWKWSKTVTDVEEHMRAAVANDKIARAEV